MQAERIVRQRAREQGPESQPREVGAALGGERADPAELDADRAEVGEPAEGERRDRERPRVRLILQSSPSWPNAISSFSTVRVPSRPPTARQSVQGTPSR